MGRAIERARSTPSEVVMVCGDFSTYLDREGATYAALLAASEDVLVDVRDVPGAQEVDAGRGSASWEGWEGSQGSRSVVGAQRHDQIFVSANTLVSRTTVPEERYYMHWQGGDHWVYASDHQPVVADLLVPYTPRALARAKRYRRAYRRRGSLSPRAVGCLSVMAVLAVVLGCLLFWLLWDLAGGTNLECHFQCRKKEESEESVTWLESLVNASTYPPCNAAAVRSPPT